MKKMKKHSRKGWGAAHHGRDTPAGTMGGGGVVRGLVVHGGTQHSCYPGLRVRAGHQFSASENRGRRGY